MSQARHPFLETSDIETSMSKAPYLPLATDAFIGDTTALNAAETGAYMMLLICQWRNNGNPLENNPKKLQRMTRCTKAQFNRIWPEIKHFFEVTENSISQKRIEKDFKVVLQKIEVKRQSGKLGGRPKSLETNSAHKANGYDSLKLIESKPKATINHNHKPEDNTNILSSDIDFFEMDNNFLLWRDEYPKAGNDKRAKKEFILALERIEFDKLMEATKDYAGSVDLKRPKYIIAPHNWLENDCWKDPLPEKDFDPIEYLRKKREDEEHEDI